MISLIYLKPTNYCNVGCKHCYLTGLTRSKFYFMTKENIDIIYEKLEEYFLFHKIKIRPRISLHGGEPLLVEKELLEYIFKKFKNYSIGIQTSLFPLFDLSKEERISYYDLFDKYNIGIGTSYDFFGTRQYKHSTELFEKNFLEIANEIIEYRKLKNYRDPKLHVVFTITKKIQGREEEVYNWLLKHNNILRFRYEEYNEYNNFNKTLYLKNSEMADILIKFYELDKRNDFKVFREFSILKEKMKYKELLPGKFCSNCQAEYLVIEPEGYVTNCPDKSGFTNDYFGNIYEEKLINILKNPTRLNWVLLGKQNLDLCNGCEFKNICKGGCPLKKRIAINKKITDRLECSGFYPFLKHISEDIKKENPF